MKVMKVLDAMATALGLKQSKGTPSQKRGDRYQKHFGGKHAHTRSHLFCPACGCNPSMKDGVCRNSACKLCLQTVVEV